MMPLSEKQIEDVFEVFYKQLISKDLDLVGRQYHFQGLFLDLLFKDSTGRNVMVELKKDAPTMEEVGKLLHVAGLLDNGRAILAAPFIATSIKKAFDHYGIEYLEFNLPDVSKLYDQIKDKPKTSKLANEIQIPISVVREPLLGRRKEDGNIAFKVTYVDSGWSGVCSDGLYEYNRTHRVWCQTQAPDCRSKDYSNPEALDLDYYPCYDSIAMKTLSFETGIYHNGPNEGLPIRCMQAKQGKLALFTSREPGTHERERLVFAIAQIKEIKQGNTDEPERFFCSQETAVTFKKPPYPQFWKYYRNPNRFDLTFWGSGLFRYVNDDTVGRLLKDIKDNGGFTLAQREAAGRLLMILD